MGGELQHGSRWEGRRRSREAAVRMLYQVEVGQLSIGEVVRSHQSIGDADAIALDDESQAYAVALVTGTWDAREGIEAFLEKRPPRWKDR